MLAEKNAGTVYLVGAGPGDPGLITLKAVECIRRADVIIYDRLLNPRILSLARDDAELIYAGKGPDNHTLSQSEINDLLVSKALEGKVVVRLKGGDPFIFGRGGEEALALASHGLRFEVVPGVTSAVAVPAYAGIPLTHRDMSSSVALVTGHEDPLKPSSSMNWDGLAKGPETLVFLMGVGRLRAITESLIMHGKDPETPAAVVRMGTHSDQLTITSTLGSIADEVESRKVTSPAVLVVGEVVSLRRKLAWFENKPLFGCKVLVTRTREQAGELSKLIELEGGEAWEFPVIETAAPEDWGPVDRAINEISSYDWLVFSSTNGVKWFFHRWKTLDRDVRGLGTVKLAAIGSQTAQALQNLLLKVELVPDDYQSENLVESFRGLVGKGSRILLARSDIGRPVLREGLKELGADVHEVHVYRTVPASTKKDELVQMLNLRQVNVITFTSSSTVKNFVNILGPEQTALLLKDVTVACIGPITAQAARDFGLNVDVMPENYTIKDMVAALVDYRTKRTKEHAAYGSPESSR